MQLKSKLPKSEITIFTVMSALANKHQAINLGQGFPDFDCDKSLRDLVVKYVNSEKNQYCPMAGLFDLRQAISDKIKITCDKVVSPEDEICITAGATQAIFTAIMAFVHKGDEVIILEPAYDCYLPAIQIGGAIPKGYQMVYPDYAIDWTEIADMVTEKTSMIIINTPHNPTGTILQATDLAALEKIVADKNIIVLSDEVYEHLIYDGAIHQSVLRFPKLYQQSLAVFSFGKTFHSTGWKMGYAVGPKPLMDEFKNVHQWNVFCVNSFTQYALAEHLQTPSNYTQLPAFFEQKRDFLTNSLATVPLKPKLSQGTFFQLFNYSELSDMEDAEFAKYLTKEIGVAAIPLSPFYSKPPGDKVIRLCFAKKEATLAAAAKRLAKL